METPDYKKGWHKRWEVYIHELRQNAREKNTELIPAVERKLMENWLTANRITADDPTPCNTCVNEITDAVIDGRDPFAMPAYIKKLFRELGSKLRRLDTL